MAIRTLSITLDNQRTIHIPAMVLRAICDAQQTNYVSDESRFNKVEFIKALRDSYGVSLRDGKLISDACQAISWGAEQPTGPPAPHALVKDFTWID